MVIEILMLAIEDNAFQELPVAQPDIPTEQHDLCRGFSRAARAVIERMMSFGVDCELLA